MQNNVVRNSAIYTLNSIKLNKLLIQTKGQHCYLIHLIAIIFISLYIFEKQTFSYFSILHVVKKIFSLLNDFSKPFGTLFEIQSAIITSRISHCRNSKNSIKLDSFQIVMAFTGEYSNLLHTVSCKIIRALSIILAIFLWFVLSIFIISCFL